MVAAGARADHEGMSTATATTRFDSSSLPRLIGVAAASGAAAAAVGVVTGVVLYAMAMQGASDYDQWAELGALIVGVLGGIVTGGATYLTGVVVGVRKVLPAGQRLVPALGLTVLPAALFWSNTMMSAALGGFA